MFKFSMKTRVSLLFPLVITFALIGLLFLIQNLLQGYLKESISNQQFQIVSNLADEVDQKIAETHKPLLALAHKLTPEQISDPDEALGFLLERTEFTSLFDNGMFLFDRKGRMIAELPLGLSRSGKDFSYRDYLKVTFADKAPHISAPYISSQSHHHPAIMLTAPILDSNGNVLAVLGGSIDLLQSNFLGGFSQRKTGQTGYMFLFDTNRTMIVHPDKTRIMQQEIPSGANKLFDLAINGFDGSGETVNSQGQKDLTTFKHLKSNDWIIGANFPLSEAYLPVNRIRNLFLMSLPLLSLSLFWFLRRYLERLMVPIIQLTGHVEGLPNKVGADRLFPVQGSDEISTLGNVFNELVRETDRQRLRLEEDIERHERADAQLQRQNEYMQTLHETTLGLIKRLDVASVLQAIVTRSGRLVRTEHGFLNLVNSSGTELNMVYQSGIFNSLIHYPIKPGEGISGRVWATGEPIKVDDYNLWEGRLPDAGRNNLHALAGVPLKVGDEVVGVLGLAFIDEGVVISDQQMEVLVQFGELASLALENARLNEESQRELAERLRAEEHLRKLSVAVEQNPASIIITDTLGSIEYVNLQFTLLTGYSFAEAVGKNPNILKTGETDNLKYRQLWETILAGGEWRGEFHNRKKDGSLYWEEGLIAPIRNNSNVITHFIAIKVDITERRQLEGQLRHSQKMDAIGQLAGGIAHDFNNILTAIVGYASIMERKLSDDSPLKKNAGQIIATAGRGTSLTQGLLAFSRKQELNPVVVDLNEIINRVHDLLHRLISADITLEIILSPHVLPVMADSVQIEQILMNLTTNARDALPDGGSIVVTTGVISLDSDSVLAKGFGQPGDYALMTFDDNGEGISREIVKHIFEPFYTTKGVGKGTGLGLSIAYGIIKKHNGFITCESTIGIGTSFHVYLPLLARSKYVKEVSTSDIVLPGQGTAVILVAEDDDNARALVTVILQEFGYSVLEAGDGQEALQIFNDYSGRIDLLILDVIMPKLNGRQVYDAVKEIDPTIKVLFSSGYPEDVVIDQGRIEIGMNYLAKPFTPKGLLMKIREVLENGH